MMADDIRPLRERRSIGRALTHEEKLRLLRMAAQKPEWETAYCATVLALATTARSCELRNLRWGDIDFIERTLVIQESKTDAGERLIPLTPEAYETLVKLRKRAELLGDVAPAHYVFAGFRPKFRFRNKAGSRGGEVEGMDMAGFDPTRPVRSWRTAWRTLTKKAGLKGFRFHDLRHTAITALAESDASELTLKALAGHVSLRMLERYSHIRLEAKRTAILALSDRPARDRSQTAPSQNTSQNPDRELIPLVPSQELIEKVGRPERTRTVDLYRVKVAL